MAKLTNCEYNKIKILHDLSSLVWFIENHAYKDAKQEKDDICHQQLTKLCQELNQHIDYFKKLLCK